MITDAPDISSSRDLKAELQRPALGCPLALLLVMPLGSFTEKDEAVLDATRPDSETNL